MAKTIPTINVPLTTDFFETWPSGWSGKLTRTWILFFTSLLQGTASATAPFTFVFGIGSNGQPANLILNSVTNFLIMTTAGTLTGWTAVLSTACTGSTVIIDVQKNGTSVFSTKPSIPVSTTTVQNGTGFSGTVTFAAGDVLQGIVTQIGSANPGQSATLELNWN
jgi:hypothetical protein